MTTSGCTLLYDLNGLRKRRAGFSLMELLAVMVIITILAATAAPSLMQISNSAARKGAVNVLLNAFEQARVAALTSGQNTYVGFADKNFPQEDLRYRAYIIFRTASDEDNTTNHFIPLTKWEILPKNISFKNEPQSVVGHHTAGAPFELSVTDNSIPKLSSGDSLPCLVFNASGAIVQPPPSSSQNLQLFIYEGYFASNQDNFTRSAQDRNGALFERIRFSRFTGRAQLDITSVN